MIYLCAFVAIVLSSTGALDSSSLILGKVYHGMDYNASATLLARFAIHSKLTCAAVCSNQWTACRIAVYDSSVGGRCRLYSEALITARLVVSSSAVVYEFQQAKAQGRM